MMLFLTTIISPFYVLFGSWNFFTMMIVGLVAIGVIGIFIDLIFQKG